MAMKNVLDADIRLLLSGLENRRKTEKMRQKMPFCICVWASATSKSTSPPSNACGRGRRWHKASGRVTRTTAKPANSPLSRRQKQKEVGGRVKRVEFNEEGEERGKCNGQSPYWIVGRRPSTAPLISLVPGTSPPVLQGPWIWVALQPSPSLVCLSSLRVELLGKMNKNCVYVWYHSVLPEHCPSRLSSQHTTFLTYNRQVAQLYSIRLFNWFARASGV